MDDSTLDDLLASSAAAAVAEHPATDAILLAMVADAQVKARPARRRRRALWIAAIPAVPALALGLTAGIQDRLAPDLTIPVSYTTDTGVPVSCSIFVFNGEINYIETSFVGVDYLAAQDWTGIGQRIYSQALVREADITRLAQQNDPSVSPDGINPPDAAMIERMAWSLAESDLVDGSVPETILTSGDQWGGDSDCSGQLH